MHRQERTPNRDQIGKHYNGWSAVRSLGNRNPQERGTVAKMDHSGKATTEERNIWTEGSSGGQTNKRHAKKKRTRGGRGNKRRVRRGGDFRKKLRVR